MSIIVVKELMDVDNCLYDICPMWDKDRRRCKDGTPVLEDCCWALREFEKSLERKEE